jgi:hypothetical protein
LLLVAQYRLIGTQGWLSFKDENSPLLYNCSALPYHCSVYHSMDVFGSIDPAALAVAIIAVLYAMKETLSDWNTLLEKWIGNQVLFKFATVCARNGGATILNFLTDVGDPRHSRYDCDGVTIKELKFANQIIKHCAIWKMAWWMDIVLTAGLVIQVFPPPFRLLLWVTIMLFSSPIAGIVAVWDKATHTAAYRNLGDNDGYKFLLKYTAIDYKLGKGSASEDTVRMFALRTIIALGFGDDLGALGLLKLCTPSATYTREDFLTHVAVAKNTDRYYKAGIETFSGFSISLEFDPTEVWYGQVKVKSTNNSPIAVDGFSKPAGGYTPLGLSMAAKWLATAKSVKPMIPFVSWVLQTAKDAQLSKESREEYDYKQLAWRLVDTCIIISSAARAAINGDCKSDTEGLSELEMLLKPWFHEELPFYRPLFRDMKGQFPWCAIDHRQLGSTCNCLALPYEAVSSQAVVGQRFSDRVPTLVISRYESKAYYEVIYGGKNAVRLMEHNLRDFILEGFLEQFGIIVAGRFLKNTPCNGGDINTVTVQVQT